MADCPERAKRFSKRLPAIANQFGTYLVSNLLMQASSTGSGCIPDRIRLRRNARNLGYGSLDVNERFFSVQGTMDLSEAAAPMSPALRRPVQVPPTARASKGGTLDRVG
ncbi:hypothetical protein N9B45_01065 [bacterium]|nr:hypothetical protein [bacterium]